MESVGYIDMGGYSMSLTLTREALSNQIADDLATRNANSGLIESAVNDLDGRIGVNESDIATLESDLGLVEIDIVTLNGDDTTDGSVLKSIKDAVVPVSTSLDAVKVKTTENDLAIADIRRDQNLANQSEAKITTSDYGIVALPKNATGNLKMKREGLTATNLVVNGDFPTGLLTPWTYPFAGTPSVANKICSFTATAQYGRIQQNVASLYKTGNVIFVCALVRADSDLVRLDSVALGVGMAQTHSGSGNWELLCGLYTATTNIDAIVRVIDSRASGWTQVQTTGVMAINLTQTFGAGNEPTEAQCKNIFPTYFADTKNVPMTGRYRGRGKNLFDGEIEAGIYSITTGAKIFSINSIRSKNKIRVTAGLKRFSGLPSTGDKWALLYDLTGNFQGYLSVASAGTTVGTITTIDGYVSFYATGTQLYTDNAIQLELGSIATTYAPYEAHDLYLTAPEGRSVPSAKDSVEVQDGRLVHVKRVSDDLSITTHTSIVSYTTNKHWILSTKNFITLSGLTNAQLTTGGMIVAGYSMAYTDYDSATIQGKIYINNTDGTIRYITPLATTDITAIFPLTVRYQLATPIITPIDSDGSLPAGASVLWEPAIPDVGIYTNKFDILDTDHPIASIDKLYKVDFATGVQTQLTDSVIAGDGLSFTSASLSEGDLVNVIYFYSVANPEGLTTVEYLNSNVVIADTATSKYYKYKPVITNGVVVSWTATEVE